MGLITDALIEPADFISLTNRDVDLNAANTEFYEAHINAASLAIKQYIGRTVTPSVTVTELFTGDGEHDYYVRSINITSITSISYWGGTSWQEWSSTASPYTFDSDRRRVWFTQGDTFFQPSGKSSDNIRLIYVRGFKREDVPAPLRMACVKLVHRSIKAAEGREGLRSQSFGDATTTYDIEAWPKSVKALLEPYSRPAFGRV